MFTSRKYENKTSMQYSRLKYHILIQLLVKMAKISRQIIIYVKASDQDSHNETQPTIWISTAADKPVSFFHPDDLESKSKVLIKDLFQSESINKIFFNATQAIPQLEELNFFIKGKIFDIVSVDKILREKRSVNIYKMNDFIIEHLYDYHDMLPTYPKNFLNTDQGRMMSLATCINLLFPLKEKLAKELDAKVFTKRLRLNRI